MNISSGAVWEGGEPNARLLRRKERDASRGSPRSFAAQRTLAQDDNQTAPLPEFLRQCDYINLDQCIFRQPRHFDSRSGWRSRAEIFPVHFVHCRKIIHILQKDGGAHNLLQTAASRFQNAGKVFYRSIRLRSNIAGNELLVRRINRYLPRYKNESIHPDRLRIRRYRLRTFSLGYHVQHPRSPFENAELWRWPPDVR